MPKPPDEFDRAAVVTIQGGGVFGLSLLGQLQAVIDRFEIVPAALAGTSAGAIVAALLWAGLTPMEIRARFVALALDREGERPEGVETLVHLLGPFDHPGDFRRFEAMAGRFARRAQVLGRWADGPGRWWLGRNVYRPLRGAAMMLGSAIDARRHTAKRGIFPGARLVQVLDDWMREAEGLAEYRDDLAAVEAADRAARGPDIPRLLTFGHVRDLARLHPEDLYFPPLFLTATDLTTGRLELINSVDDRFRHVPIASAVRASAGFPLFFRPVQIPGLVDKQGKPVADWFVDGGVISNFPAWVFSTYLRRNLDDDAPPEVVGLRPRPWVHIGLRLAEDPVAVADPDGPRAFAEGMKSLFAQKARDELETLLAASTVPRSHQIVQRKSQTGGPKSLLDVGQMTKDKVLAMVCLGRDAAERQLDHLRFDLPAGPDERPIVAALEHLISLSLLALGEPDNARVGLRANVFVPSNAQLVLRYSANMGPDADRRTRFDANRGQTGYCFYRRRPYVCNIDHHLRLAREGKLSADQNYGLPPSDLAKIRPDRTWLASVPIFDPLDSWRPPPRPGTAFPPVEGLHLTAELDGDADGGVLGVLNLDANFGDKQLNWPAASDISLTGAPAEVLIDIMSAVALEVGRLLSDAFAPPRRDP